MDAEISKQTKKILEKQGLKFKLNTKVTAGDDSGESIKLNVEAAKGGKEETVSQLTPGKHGYSLTPTLSSTLTSFWSPSAAAHTQLDSVWRMLDLRQTTRDDS